MLNQRLDLDQGRTEMEVQNLLRPSRTIRSSIQSLSSLNDELQEEEEDIEEQKPHGKPGSSPNCFLRILCIVSVSLPIYVIFIYFIRDGINASENLLLVLIFIAILLYLAGRNKGFVRRSFWFLRRIHDGCTKKVSNSRRDKPVEWFIGEESTEAVEFLSNGDFYEGEFHKGKCNGSGVYYYFVSGRYEGDWIDGRYDGYGIESWARGSRYRGQYRQGLRHGYGVYRFFTGDTYAGEWLNGQSNGVGMQTCSDGSCYVGEFKSGVKHGLGCYHFRNGDKYAGEYFGDKIHGFGVYQFANGHCYAGSWHEGRKQGYGVYTFQSGEKRCGEWDRGNLKLPMSPFSDMVVRAFEAARKTVEKAIQVRRVEKAIQVRRVDQQVNEAATAAKKAATAARVAAVKAVQNRMDGKFCETNIY